MDGLHKKIFMIAILFSVITSIVVYSYMSHSSKTSKAPQLVKTFAAAKTIPARAVITPSDIKEVEVEKKNLLTGAFQNQAEIIGKRAKDSIIAGEQILKDRLVSENNMNLSYTLPKGKRAVSINVNEASEVANYLKAGDSVDVIVTLEKEEVNTATQKITYPKISKTVLQGILVLGVGQDEGQVNNSKENAKKELPKTVTLAVNPNEAEKLVFASEDGVIRLALRPAGDESEVQLNGVIRKEISGTKGVQ